MGLPTAPQMEQELQNAAGAAPDPNPGTWWAGTSPGCSRWVLFPSEPSHGPAQVLRSCAAVPEVIEVLFNSYSQILVCREWAKAVPQEVFQVRQHCWFGRVFPIEQDFIFPTDQGFIFPTDQGFIFPTQQEFIFSPTQTSLGWRKIERNTP